MGFEQKRRLLFLSNMMPLESNQHTSDTGTSTGLTAKCLDNVKTTCTGDRKKPKTFRHTYPLIAVIFAQHHGTGPLSGLVANLIIV